MEATKQIGQEQKRRLMPACSIQEEDGKVVLTLEMPGVEKDDVTINVENDELRILGKRRAPSRQSKYLLRERTVADYFSSYTLNETIDRNKIEAATSQGVFTITMHLTEASKPRQITVKEIG
jgi:HSP20 family protein